MLESRMRRPSRVAIVVEESLKSIKSTDSKKIPIFQRLAEEAREETPPQILEQLKLSEEEIKVNRKITDYFPMSKEQSRYPRLSPTPQPA
jgi:hypothetical protein